MWHVALLLTALAQPDEPITTTRHAVVVDGRTLRYTARAGRLAIRDNETGDVHGQMFFVSYTLDRTPGQPPRPLTFAWNGGPGSHAALVHLVGFGPRRMVPGRAGARWVMQDNPGTWLPFTDLVFVDPIGTGYSRPTRPEYAAEFYQTRGDAESVAEFIRVYRTRFDAFDAPLFLAGESFGVVRAAGVAGALQTRGTDVRGLILIGLAVPLGHPTAEQRTAFAVPTNAVAGFTHGKLEPGLQRDLHRTMAEAERWAMDVYAPALARRETLDGATRDSVIRGLARFSGLDPGLIDRASMVIPRMQVGTHLLRQEMRFVGQYDTRRTAALDTTQRMYDPRTDPSLTDLLDPVTVLRYYRHELGYANDLYYQGPFGGGYPAPTTFRGDWMSVRWNRPAPGDSAPGRGAAGPLTPAYALDATMRANPTMRILVGCGYFDMVCDYFGNEWVARSLEPALAGRVTARRYAGGHAMYTDHEALMTFRRDVADLIREAVQPGRRP